MKRQPLKFDLNSIYELFLKQRTLKNYETLCAASLTFISKRLEKKYANPLKPFDWEDLAVDALINIMDKIDPRKNVTNSSVIEDFESYVFTTSRNLYLKRIKNQKDTVSIEEVRTLNTLSASYQVEANIEVQQEDPLFPSRLCCLNKLIIGILEDQFTLKELGIIGQCTKEYYEDLLGNEIINAKTIGKMTNAIKRKARNFLEVSGPSFTNHFKRIEAKIKDLNINKDYQSKSSEEILDALLKKAKAIKSSANRKNQHKYDYAVLGCYYTIILLEPKYWNAIRNNAILDLQAYFWEAQFQICNVLWQMKKWDAAEAAYLKFINKVKQHKTHSLTLSHDGVVTSLRSKKSLNIAVLEATEDNKIEFTEIILAEYYIRKSLNQLGIINKKSDDYNLHLKYYIEAA